MITVTYYHDGASVRIDNDNSFKPIGDALIGVIYADDRLIVRTSIHKTSIDGRFRVRRMSRVLADAFVDGREFIHIRIDQYEGSGELP
jgi:crossover junction endodeoxyribonuclease RusA